MGKVIKFSVIAKDREKYLYNFMTIAVFDFYT